MAQRGRPKKIQTVATKVTTADYEKLLKQREQEQQVQFETLYKQLSKIKKQLDLGLTHIGFIDSCDNLAEAAFKAGRAFSPLDKANDELGEILDVMYGNSHLEHWADITNED
jgi:hypothetical protein